MFRQNWLVRGFVVLGLVCTLMGAGLPTASRAVAVDDAQQAGDAAWDNRFGLPGVESSEVESIAVGANGDIYIAGGFSEAGNIEVNQVARWDGRQFHPLGSGLAGGSVAAIASDGTNLYAVGSFTSAGAVSVNGIARWNGTEWSAVGSGEGATDESGNSGWLHTVAVYDGKLVIGGDFDFVDGVAAKNIAAWNGTSWSALGTGIYGPEEWSTAEVRTLLAVGSKLYVGGSFELAGSVTANSIAMWNGSKWSAVGGGVTMVEGGTPDLGEVYALAYGNNTLYAGGYFNRAGGKTVNYVAQYVNGEWSGLGSGVRLEDFSTDTPINALLFRSGVLYVGGNFTAAGGKPIDLLASWDGANWSEVAGGIPDEGFDQVYALASAPSGLVAGGLFRIIADKRVDNVALLAGGEWQALGQGIADDFGDAPGEPFAMASDAAGNIFVGGDFTRLGGVPGKNLGVWNGSRWYSIGDANDTVRALAIGGGYLYAGGNFTQIGGVAASHVARMNLQNGQWSALGSGINGDVRALVYSDGILYAGGDFKAAGSVTAEDVAWWDGAAWHPFGSKYRIFEIGDKGSEVGTYVNALAVAGNSVYIGGHFQTIQFGTNTSDLSTFVVVHNVVEWNPATDEWNWVGSPQKPGVTTDGFSGFGTDVYALAIVGNSLFVGGDFNQAGDLAATGGMARWDRAAGQWVSIEGSLGGLDDVQVRSLAASGADLLVAGKFTSAGAALARYIARFDTLTNNWVALGSGLRWYNDRFTQANVVLATETGVYVGGEFDRAGEKGSLGFARWTGALNAPNLTPEQGGTIQKQGVQVTFPAGAVTEDSVVTVDRTAQPAVDLPTGWSGVYGLRVAATTVSGKQLGETAKAFSVRASYTAAELQAAGISDASTLKLVMWDGTAWQTISTNVDTQNRVVTGSTKQLQPLALVGQGSGTPPGGDIKLFLPSIRK